MAKHIVDTNVALVANGAAPNVKAACRLATIDFLEGLIYKGELVVDLNGEVEAEYRKQLGDGMPGVGHRFLQKFFSEAAHRVSRVEITPRGDNYAEFKFEGSLRKFDKSDRKFVALAAACKAPIYNAADTDWLDHQADLNAKGIVVTFLCGCNRSDWFV
jgi:predicted nucleic acid-binding protein